MCKKLAIVIDIDGVILDSYQVLKDMYHKNLKDDSMWDYFHKNCNDTFQVPFMSNILLLMNALKPEIDIILSTSRNEKCRKQTEERLHREGINYKKLLMRPQEDFRPSPEIKREHIAEILKDYTIIAFVDDDLSNCQMVSTLGILALRRV